MRLLIRWALGALTLLAIAYTAPSLGILPGFHVSGFEAAVVAAAILSLLNLTVRPILRWLTMPITCLTFGLFALVINAAVMMLTDALVSGFEVGGFRNALVVSVIYAVAMALLGGLVKREKKD